MRRILFTETDFNTLPNPPAGFKYIGFDGPNFSAKDEAGSTMPTGGGAGGVVDVAHSELLDKIDAGDLIPGTYYKITDFKTCYDQPDYILGQYGNFPVNGSGLSDNLFPEYKVGATHSVIVFALDVDKLASDAYQPDYPKDQIKYDVAWNATEINGLTAYGRITERIDEFGNRTDFDHREVLFKRYPQYSYSMGEHLLNGTIEMLEDGTVTGTNSTFLDLSEGDVIALPGYWQRLFKITSIEDNFAMTVTGSSIPNTGSETKIYSTTKDGYFRYAKNNIDPDDYEQYPTFSGESRGNYFGNYIIDNPGEFVLANNVFDGTLTANTFGDYCTNNTIDSDNFAANSIGDAFSGNTITAPFYANSIDSIFYNNIINVPFYENKIGTEFLENEIGILQGNSGDFSNNTIENGFKGNLIDGAFGANQIGYAFCYNEVLGGFYENSIESYFIGNNTDDDFTRNKIGSYFNSNQISYYFESNSIGNFFSSNQISYNFAYNEIGNNFGNNVVENDFGYGGGYSRGNKIGNYFQNNNIGEYFYDNRISDLFQTSTCSNYFQFNDIKTQINSTDFTTYNGNISTFTYGFGGTLPIGTVGITYSNVSGTYSYAGSTASVTDAKFDIHVVSPTSLSVTLRDSGKYYKPYIGFTSSTIAISDSKFGGTGSNDLSIIVTAVSDLPSVYAEYNTEIFKRAGGVNRLSYYDASDVLTIKDIDK